MQVYAVTDYLITFSPSNDSALRQNNGEKSCLTNCLSEIT